MSLILCLSCPCFGFWQRPATDAFRNLTLNVKPKGDGLQGLNAKRKDNGFQGYQQKAKESTPVSFSFLKSLDATASTSGVVEDDSFFGSNAINSKDSLPNVRSTSQNLTPDFLKSFGAKNEPTHEARSSSYHEVKRISSHEAKSVSSHESKSAFMERPGRAPSNANEVTSATTRTTYPGYTVCIRNLPSHGNLALVKEALSLHGEVISSFKKSNSDGTCNAFVEFKVIEAALHLALKFKKVTVLKAVVASGLFYNSKFFVLLGIDSRGNGWCASIKMGEL